MTLKIEKNVPIPVSGKKGYSELLRKLTKGDSVVLPCSGSVARSMAAYVLGAGAYACRKEEGGYRIWKK